MTPKKHINQKLRNSTFFIIIAIITFFSIKLCGNNREGDSKYHPSRNYQFANRKVNKLLDEANSMSPFFSQLFSLKEIQDTIYTVSIVHIGDSHIQADFETAETRSLFQQYFGSAGRGFITPLKLAKTNEPRNYRITSSQTWNAYKTIKPSEIPIGMGGLTLQTNNNAGISVEILDIYSTDNQNFNEAIAYYDTSGADISLPDTSILLDRSKISPYSERVIFKDQRNSLDFDIYSTKNKDIYFYGVELRNGQSGILYHSIGINGAHYADYANKSLFFKQMALLNPYLIIISLGTNEAYAPNFNTENFYVQIDQTVKGLKKYSPQAVILLATPAETWKSVRISKKKRGFTPNAQTKSVRDVIVRYARENQLVCWDLFSITGGEGSAKNWNENDLLARDRIHFTKQGYEYQGELLFEAIYNTYLENLQKQ